MLTAQDYDLYRIGGWQRVYEDAHKKTPPYRDGLYVISLGYLVAGFVGAAMALVAATIPPRPGTRPAQEHGR